MHPAGILKLSYKFKDNRQKPKTDLLNRKVPKLPDEIWKEIITSSIQRLHSVRNISAVNKTFHAILWNNCTKVFSSVYPGISIQSAIKCSGLISEVQPNQSILTLSRETIETLKSLLEKLSGMDIPKFELALHKDNIVLMGIDSGQICLIWLTVPCSVILRKTKLIVINTEDLALVLEIAGDTTLQFDTTTLHVHGHNEDLTWNLTLPVSATRQSMSLQKIKRNNFNIAFPPKGLHAIGQIILKYSQLVSFEANQEYLTLKAVNEDKQEKIPITSKIMTFGDEKSLAATVVASYVAHFSDIASLCSQDEMQMFIQPSNLGFRCQVKNVECIAFMVAVSPHHYTTTIVSSFVRNLNSSPPS